MKNPRRGDVKSPTSTNGGYKPPLLEAFPDSSLI
jgi:hypothetical protein